MKIKEILCKFALISVFLAPVPPLMAADASFELLHLWAVKEEQHALEAFTGPLKQAGVEWNEQIVKSNFDGIRREYAERLSLGLAPTGAFWIGGGHTLIKMIENEVFRVIPNSWSDRAYDEIFSSDVYSNIMVGDGISILPLGIHIQNYIAYNTRVLKELNAPFPKSWQDFLQLAPELHKAGVVPLSMSDQHWQLRFLFTSIIAEKLTSNEVRDFLVDGQIAESITDDLIDSLMLLRALKPYVNSDYQNLDWKEAVDQVRNNKAFANVLGDFVAPVYVKNPDIQCAMPFGNQFLLWSFDAVAFTNTNNAAEINGQKKLVDSVLNEGNNHSYISRKGGVSVLRDSRPASGGSCSQVSDKIWKSTADKVLLTSSAWGANLSLLGSLVASFWTDDSVSAKSVVQALKDFFP